MCLFIHAQFEKRFYVNKTRLGFFSSNFTRVAFRKDVCIFAISISKSVSRATVVFFVGILLLFTQLLYFIRKLVILVILDQGNVVFVSFCAV